MRFKALATDYDGTLAHDGELLPSTLAALERFKDAGGAVVMVTGREVPDLERVCPTLGTFDLVVAENGGVLFQPRTRALTLLAAHPPRPFIHGLVARGVDR